VLRTLTDDPLNAEADLSDLGEGLTANDRFYVRCNFSIPDLDVETWSLELGGAFERRRRWSLVELQMLPPTDRVVLLECAGNGRTLMAPVPPGTPWSLGAVGIARFGGVRLADLLDAAGLRSSALDLVFTGADEGPVERDGTVPYQFDLPVDRLESTDPILAWTMNGDPLPSEHGFPVRLVVPGDYGMRSVKWLTRIDAHQHGEFDAHFPRKYRYRGETSVAAETPVAEMRVRSLFTFPERDAVLAPGGVSLRGIAWSGAGPISGVFIHANGGWHPARIVERMADAAARWEFDWEATPGAHTLAGRATDAAGATQPDMPAWNEGGYGNNVVQQITVQVR